MKTIKGFTLIELMIALAVSSIVAVGVMKAYVGQSVVIVRQARTTQATEDGREAFTILSRLLKQSVASTISINQPDTSNTTIDFTIPDGFPIWPNETAPYSNSAIRLSWTDTGDDAHKILLSTATSIANLGAATTANFAGDSTSGNTQISSLTLDDNADGSYSLTLIAQVENGASSSPLTASFESMILPRN